MVSQVQDSKYCLMTWLEQYRSNPATAPPYLTMVFFDELLESKDTVLFRSDIIAADLSKPVATRAVKYFREFYIDDRKFQDVKMFNHNPRNFDFEDFKKRYTEYF